MSQALSQRRALADFAPKMYRRARKLSRLWTHIRIIYTKWDIGNSDSALYRMHGEREQVDDAIAAEMVTRCNLVDELRQLQGRL